VDPAADNAQRVFEALRDFGAPLANVSIEDFRNPDLVYQIGVEPLRIDVLMGVAGLEFDTAWQNRAQADFAGEPVGVLCRSDWIIAKRASGRAQDRIDTRNLLRYKPKSCKGRSSRRPF